MAFGKSKPASYGVPVRAAAPPSGPDQAAYGQQGALAPVPWAAAPPPPAGVYAPVVGAPVPMGAQFAPAYAAQAPAYAAQAPAYAPQASAYAPQAGAANPYAPLAPTPYPPQQSWAPAPYANPGWAPPVYASGLPPNPPYQAKKPMMRKPFKIAGAVILVLILAGVVAGQVKQKSALKPPAALAGRTLTTDPKLLREAKTVTAQMRGDNAGSGATAAYYTDTQGRVTLALVAVRGVTDEERDLRDLERSGVVISRQTRTTYGNANCYQAGATAICLWHAEISGVIMLFDGSDLNAASAVAAEAQAALH